MALMVYYYKYMVDALATYVNYFFGGLNLMLSLGPVGTPS